MKLLLQELESISIAPRLVTDDVKNTNRGLMSYIHQNISKNSIEDDFFDDEGDVEDES